MKTLKLTFAALLLSMTCVFAQQQEVYCKMTATAKLLNPNKINIALDYGQELSIWKDQRLKDEATGKAKSFNSIVDALNYMAKEGWSLVQAYTVTMSGQHVYNYLLKKEVDASMLQD